MLEHLPCVRIDPAPFRPPPIGGSMEERAIRFELERQACQSLRQVLQLKLQQRRSREELVNQGIMPPLKSSATFHEQRRNLERARTEDYLKRKIKSRPEKSDLIRMHILEESSAEPSLQAKQLLLKRARLADDLNDKIAHRPGPMELIHKNILPVHSSIKQAIIETQFPKASGENSSCDEDSIDSLSPEQPVSQDCPAASGPGASPVETLAGGSAPSPAQVPSPVPPLPPITTSCTSLKLTNGTVAISVQRTAANCHIKPKPTSDRSAQKHKKAKDNKPKIKKLKYHQYIPPDQKGDKEPPPHLDSSYAKILQQQQLFLQLQILSQQQQHYNYHTILPAPPKPQTDQPSNPTSSPPRPAAGPSTVVATKPGHIGHCSAVLGGNKPTSLPLNLDEMKVAELKSELKLRSLTLSGTKNDLIERLRSYQELNGGGDTTSSPTAGGTTGPGAEGAGTAFRTAAITTNNSNTGLQQKAQCHQTLTQTVDGTSAVGTPQQLMTSGGGVPPPPVSLIPSATKMSPEDARFNNKPLGELISPPLTQLTLEQFPTVQLLNNIKEEPRGSTPAHCHFSLESSSPQKPCFTSSAAQVMTIDKDRMLREKDKQIEELTRMLNQKQMLVELLRRQLEHENPEGRVAEPLLLLKVKEEPPDKSIVAQTADLPPFTPQVSSASHEMDTDKVTIKEEAEEEAVQSSDSQTLLQPSSHSPIEAERKMEPQYVCLQQSTLQLAQQQAIQKLLLQQQQQTSQNINQEQANQHNLQKLRQERKKKSQKQQLKQQQEQQQQQQQQQSKQLQQMQLKQQILLKQQKSLIQQQLKQQQQSKQAQQVQIQTKIHMKPQQVLIKQKQQEQQTQQVSLSGSTSSFSLDLLKSDSTPTLVTDNNGNHFLIALTNHIPGNQRSETSEGKAANHITLQRLQSTPAKLPDQNHVQLTRAHTETKQNMLVGNSKQQNSKTHNGGQQVSGEQPQSLSAPPALQPFFKDQETALLGKNNPSPSSQTVVEHEEDFIDIILQTGEMSDTLPSASAPSSFHHLNHNSSASPAPPSPLPQLPPSCDPPQSEERQHLSPAGSGRLEDYLESTTGNPLLGVEPGGLLTVFDDLNSQMLCTPSILDHPSSPIDTFDMVTEGEQALDSMDWLDFTMGDEREGETPTLAPLGTQTSPSVFSTDCLDSYDLYIHWDSCL